MSNLGQEDFSVELDNGKYAITALVGGGFRWMRHGEPWPAAANLTHSKVVVSLIHRVHDLEVELHQRAQGDAPAIGQRAAHYGDGVQPWDHILSSGWGPEFAAGNALKYVRRYKAKNGIDDLKKGQWYYHELVAMVANYSQYATDSLKTSSHIMLQLEQMLTQEERAILRAVQP